MNNPYHSISPAYPQKVLRDFRVKVILLIAAFVFSCFSAIRALVETWSVQDIYSYGYLVPAFSLMWIWHKKESIRHFPINPALISGMIVLLTGGLMLVLGRVGGTSIVQELAIVVIIPGLVLMLLGTKYLAALSLPLSYLVLMVPLLDGFVDRLHWPFRMFAAATAVKLLNVVNIPVLRTNQFLELPNITLEVVDACSGVRFLLSTIVLCIPLAFITQKSWVRRALLFLFAILISICANPLRVTLVAAWAYYGDGDIHGPLHIFQGYVVYLIGLTIIFIAAWYLQRGSSETPGSSQKPERANSPAIADRSQINRAWLVSVLMLLSFGAYIHLFQPHPVQLKTSLNLLPAVIGEWQDKGTSSDVPSPSLSGADSELTRIYRNTSGSEIQLRVSYFESQRQGKKIVSYELRSLYENSKELMIPESSHHAVAVNKTVLKDKRMESLILSWYDINGRIVASRSIAKTILALNGLLHGRTNGAVIIVSSPTMSDGVDVTQRNAVSFVQQLLPVLDNFIPDANR